MIELDSEMATEIGFTSDRFDGWLWLADGRVMVSMIISKQSGQGHVSALFKAIEERGLRVAVPTPFPRMRAILERKGFTPHTEDTDMGPCEVWERPRWPT